MQVGFLEWLINGGLVIFSLIAAGLFIVQAIFTFILWRKGEAKYKFKFITYAIAAAAIIEGSITYIVAELPGGLSTNAQVGLIAVFLVMVCIAGGMQIYFFIRESWLKKEAKA